jgi:predicted RNA binding protein YcfA (HicA-like mRNA interferase family)
MKDGLPVITPRKLIRVLQRIDFYIHHVEGSHYTLRHHTRPELRITVPYHNRELSRITLRSMLKQAKLTAAEFRTFCSRAPGLTEPHLAKSDIRVRHAAKTNEATFSSWSGFSSRIPQFRALQAILRTATEATITRTARGPAGIAAIYCDSGWLLIFRP